MQVADIFREDYGMFVWNDETRTFWFNACSLESDLEFKLVGCTLFTVFDACVWMCVHTYFSP